MHHNSKIELSEIAFEPSQLVEYGEARERTQNAGGPANTIDGNQYAS